VTDCLRSFLSAKDQMGNTEAAFQASVPAFTAHQSDTRGLTTAGVFRRVASSDVNIPKRHETSFNDLLLPSLTRVC
jgi:hypothetical protein